MDRSDVYALSAQSLRDLASSATGTRTLEVCPLFTVQLLPARSDPPPGFDSFVHGPIFVD
jgi:hypothetical protein